MDEPLMPILCSIDAHLTSLGSAGCPVRADAPFGHDEQRQALGARGRALDARQHQVDDVLRQVVVAAGDEDLRAADLVAAVGVLLREGGRGADVGAGLRLGEAHGAGPLAVEHLVAVAFALLGVPNSSITSAAPMVRPGYMSKAVFDPLVSSVVMAESTRGAPCPPNSAGTTRLLKPLS